MDKQRLMELAGVVITEARQAGASEHKYVVVTYDDGYFNVVGPFTSEKEAEKYVKWEISEFDLHEEHYGKVTEVMGPEW